jgi:putative ATPase
MEQDLRPLADRMRPQNLAEFVGQEAAVGSGTMLRQFIDSGRLPSLVFWGPPGSGKTTLASIIARQTESDFVELSAVSSGVKDLKAVVAQASVRLAAGRQTILFVDEIHRWNKTQQDSLLPHIEKGRIILIGATTENPSFELRAALLSRCRVIVLKSLSPEDIANIIKRALSSKERGLGGRKLKVEDEAVQLLAQLSNGDARTALNVLEMAASLGSKLSSDKVKEAFQKSHLLYDKSGEEHYNIISALHKSMRGSDADGAIYWLARMLEAGEDPLYIARRIVRFAAEDIGLANSRALEQAVAAYQACHFIGMPECGVVLAQAVVYMAKCPKSVAIYKAYKQAAADVAKFGNQPVPLHLRNAPTKLMKDLGYGQEYKYSPDHDYKEKQEYLPEKLRTRRYLSKI